MIDILFSQKEKGKKGTKTLIKEIMAENVPNLGKRTNLQVQEAQKRMKKDESKENHTKTHYK